jgi:hypothetical protein
MLDFSSHNALTLAATATATPAWLPVVGTLGGVLLTGLFSLLAATLARRWQQEAATVGNVRELQKAVRGDRIAIYPKFLDKSRRLNFVVESQAAVRLKPGASPHQLVKMWGAEFGDALNEFNETLNAVYLVGGDEVRRLASGLESALVDNIRIRAFGTEGSILPDVGELELKLLESMRRELSEPGPGASHGLVGGSDRAA